MTERVEVVIDGTVGPLRQKLREGLQNIKQFGDEAGSAVGGMTSPLQAVTEKFVAFTAVLAGGAFAGEAIRETVKFTKEVNELSRMLGISATEATAWNIALGDIYQDSGALTGVIGKLSRILAEDESKLTALGIATRDTNGHLKSQGEIFLAVATHLTKFREGTDRNIEGARIFGKSWSEVAPMLNLTSKRIEDAAEKARSLGLTMTEEGQARVSAYRAAMNDVGDVLLGVKNVIGHALMPVLTQLGQWFSDAGPYAVVAFRGAVGGLVSIFWGLKNAVTIAWETITAMIYTVTEPIRSLGSALLKLLKGDFKSANDEMMTWPERIGAVWRESWKNMVASSEDARNKLEALFVEGGTPTKTPGAGELAKPGNGDKPKSRLAYFEEQLAIEQQFLAAAGEVRLVNKQQELEYWQTILRTARLSAEDRLAISRKAANLEVEIRKQAAQQQKQIDQDTAQAAEQLAMARLEGQRIASQALRDNGEITAAQLTQIELSFEDERYNIQLAALKQRLKLLELDPNTNAVEMARIKNQVLLAEQEHQNKRTKLMLDASKQGGLGGAFKSLEEDSYSALQSILQGTTKWYSAMSGIFNNLKHNMINALVMEPLKEMTAGWGKMLAMKLGFITAETTAQAAGSAATVGIKAAETTAVASANAVQAGTGAAASQAPIPIIGPALALAAMAAIFAAVSGMGSKVKSARGGMDIPAGINPFTQLHEEEMVLPKGPANLIRRMAGEDGAGGAQPAGGTVVYNDHSGRLTRQQIRDNARTIAEELARVTRYGWRPAS